MLRSGYVFLCGLLLVTQAYSQSSARVDSLLAALPHATDSTEIAMLNALCWELQYADPQAALQYGEKALTLAKEQGYLPGLAQAYNNIGFIKYNESDYEEAIQLFLESLKIEEKLGVPMRIGHRMNSLGMAFSAIKQYEQAFKYYQQAINITRSIPDKLPHLYALNGLGVLQMERGLLSEARDYFFKMLTIANAHQIHGLAGMAYRHLGEMFLVTYRYDSALLYLSKSANIFHEIGDRTNEAIALNNLGEIYFGMEDYEQAEKFAQEALSLRTALGNQYGMMITQNLMAKIYRQSGDLDQAIALADTSLSLAQQMNAKEGMRDALEVLMQLHLQKKNYARAVAYRQDYIAIKDSILNEEMSLKVAGLQMQFELEKKEQQIAAQQQQIVLLEQNKAIEKRLRFAFFISTVLVLFLALFIYQRYRLKQKSAHHLSLKNQEIAGKNEEIERVNRALEKRMLRAQMDPHFVFNSLSAIQHFITISDKTSALKYLSKFSRLIRQVLENSSTITVSIADEIKVLEYYLELESLRFNHQFEYSIQVDGNINIHDTEIPFLLLQPYVENAIVHGFCKGDVKGKLKITLDRYEDHVICIIEDNGIGRKAAQSMNGLQQHIPRGVSVAQKRLSLVNQENQHKTCVEITDLHDPQHFPMGTRVEIRIPLELN